MENVITVKRLLLDVLKPRELSIIELSKAMCSTSGVDEVEAIVSEVDSRTETIKMTIKGQQIEYDDVSKVMEKYGVSLKGVDEINVFRSTPESKIR